MARSEAGPVLSLPGWCIKSSSGTRPKSVICMLARTPTHARTQYNYSGAQTINQVALTWMGLERAFCLLVPAPWLLFRSGGPNGVGQTGHATPTLHGSHVQPTLSVVLVYVISTSMLNADAGSLPCCTYHPSSQNRHCQINQKFGCRWSQRTVLMPQVLACGWA